MTTYIKPTEVTTPKDKWQLIDVIWDGGASTVAKEQFALAYGIYEGDEVLAIRWNGTDEEGAAGKGAPRAATHPTWFFMPHYFDAGVLLTVAVGQLLGKSKHVRNAALGDALQSLLISKSALLQRFEMPLTKVIEKTTKSSRTA